MGILLQRAVCPLKICLDRLEANHMNKIKIGATGVLVSTLLLLSACSSSVTTLIPPQATAQPAATQPPSEPQPKTAQSLPAVAAQPALLASYEGTLETIYQQVDPSVVNIRVVQKQDTQSFSFGNFPDQLFPFSVPNLPDQQTPQYSQGLGSGFVWDAEGHIVTNNHVVDGADKVEVTFTDGLTVSAKVIGTDSYSDLAVIQVDAPSDSLKPVQVGDSNQVKVGQLAVAIGNPFGLEGTMTAGIISAIGRSLSAGSSTQAGAAYSIPDVIQTDAPINPGNSGGVLVNALGEVIGVTSAIESPVQANAGIGFAIPSALVQKVIPGLIKDGTFNHPYLGVSGTTMTPELANAMKLDENQKGALIEEITPGGPADKANLHGSDKQVDIEGSTVLVGGDVVTAVNGEPIKSMDDLIAYLFNQTEVGQKVTLTLLRDGKETQVDVTLEARPTTTNAQNSDQNQASTGVWLGIQAQPVTADIAKAMNLPEDQKGIIIGQVESGSPADKAGLRGSYKPVDINGQQVLVGGDIITSVDTAAISSVQELRDQIQNKSSGDEVILTIIRDGKTMEVSVILADQPG